MTAEKYLPPIGKQLRKLRENRGLTQGELGALVNLTPEKVSAIERGKRTMLKSELKLLGFKLDLDQKLIDRMIDIRY